MTVEVLGVDGNVVSIKVTGKLTETELASTQQATAGVIRELGKVRIFIDAGNFDGWEQGGSWNDFSFEDEFDPYIEKMAIVGDSKWEELILVFSNKGFREFPIEYFDSAESRQALSWIKS